MRRIFGLIAFVALPLFAAPVDAQQDTSALGRQAEGIPTEQAGQPQQPDTAGLTTRQGIEQGQPAARAQVAEPTEAAADTEIAEGAEMPRTASSLPILVLAGSLLIALGLALRGHASRS
jgi:hypothetical protein